MRNILRDVYEKLKNFVSYLRSCGSRPTVSRVVVAPSSPILSGSHSRENENPSEKRKALNDLEDAYNRNAKKARLVPNQNASTNSNGTLTFSYPGEVSKDHEHRLHSVAPSTMSRPQGLLGNTRQFYEATRRLNKRCQQEAKDAGQALNTTVALGRALVKHQAGEPGAGLYDEGVNATSAYFGLGG